MKGNYDHIARYYDRLSRIVFGNTLIDAQLYLLDAIPEGARVLIAGGGSGWILEAITRLHPSGLNITYVDASAKMIALARKRNAGNNNVTFVVAPVEDTRLPELYDVVITPFLFDNFTTAHSHKIFSALDKMLTNKGVWLYCDYRDTEVFWQKSLLKMMYAFFRLVSGIEASQMPEMAVCFGNAGYNIEREKTFMKGFIEAIVYKRIAGTNQAV